MEVGMELQIQFLKLQKGSSTVPVVFLIKEKFFFSQGSFRGRCVHCNRFYSACGYILNDFSSSICRFTCEIFLSRHRVGNDLLRSSIVERTLRWLAKSNWNFHNCRLQRVSLPVPSVMFSIHFSKTWSVLIIIRVPSMCKRNITTVQTMGRHPRFDLSYIPFASACQRDQ